MVAANTLSVPQKSSGSRWNQMVERFLAAIDPSQRSEVAQVLQQPNCGGPGLRKWLQVLAAQSRTLPELLPPSLVDVYLNDPEAAPLHDCSQCGLVVPVHVDRGSGPEGESGRSYFPTCPACGGRTGPYAYWAAHSHN